MRTTIDGAGRVVIPKALREELGLRGGQEIEVTLRDGHVEIEPAPTSMRLVRRKGVLTAEPETSLPRLTAGEVRDVLDRARR